MPDRRAWYRHGKWHRKDGPAIEWFYRNGVPELRMWYLHGELHRGDGPAEERFRNNGALVHSAWFWQGKLHCEDGPATMWLNEDGRSVAAVYCLGGERISKREHRRRAALRKLAASAVAGKPGVSL